MEDVPVKIGDTFTVAQLSPCVGGLLRTWTDSDSGRLWCVEEADYLRSVQGTGTISRTLREEKRFREVASLCEASGKLMIHSRFPANVTDDSIQLDSNVIQLRPAGAPNESVYDDMVSLLKQAVRHAVVNNEFLIIEQGGWDAPVEPFCLQFVHARGEDFIVSVQTSPPPHDSDMWRPHIVPGQPSVSVSAPADEHTVGVAPLLMMEAISRWGLAPWDLALTFGRR